jgi:hypothetical protein
MGCSPVGFKTRSAGRCDSGIYWDMGVYSRPTGHVCSTSLESLVCELRRCRVYEYTHERSSCCRSHYMHLANMKQDISIYLNTGILVLTLTTDYRTRCDTIYLYIHQGSGAGISPDTSYIRIGIDWNIQRHECLYEPIALEWENVSSSDVRYMSILSCTSYYEWLQKLVYTYLRVRELTRTQITGNIRVYTTRRIRACATIGSLERIRFRSTQI